MMSLLLRRHLLVAAMMLTAAVALGAADLQSGANVYLLSMRSSFDVFLANQLTQSATMTVVTDAALADYIFTDSVGLGFEQSMETLYPKPKAEEAEPEEEDGTKGGDSKSIVQAYSSTPPRPSSFSRADGNFFLVNRHTRAVVWSTFLDHRDTRSEALNKDAKQVVKRLQEFLKQLAAPAAQSR